MPELPEAETIARALRVRLLGRRFTRVLVRRRDIIHGNSASLGNSLRSRRVTDVFREGKRIVIVLDDCARIVVALGMTGTLTAEPVSAPILPHTHLRIGLSGTVRELRFRDPRRFGGIWYLNGKGTSSGRQLSPLGADALIVRPAPFRDLLKRDRQIKALLMDQRVIAGLGNIYCDEALHRAGIHPLACAGKLSSGEAASLRRHMRAVLREAIKLGGSTISDYRNADGRSGSFQDRHRVYNQEGKPCRTCKTPIIRIQAAGRSTHLCPQCQRLESDA